MDIDAINSVYSFIAELLGYKRGTVSGKLEFGKNAFNNRQLPDEDPDTLHEIIWLKRLYGEMEALNLHMHINGTSEGFHWKVPIELDASASMIGYIGCLLGDVRLLTMTNMAGDPNQLEDPWYIEGLSRPKVKAAATPLLYGSSQNPLDLWKKKDLDYNHTDLEIINEALRSGALGIANEMKDFVIRHCNPKEEMTVKVWNDVFTIKCNHYRRIGDVHVPYDLFDTTTQRVRRITHTKTKAVPDLERFRSYFQTLLIHNLDSQVADWVSGKCMKKYGFCLDVHDAFIVSPIAAKDVRKWYAERMDWIYKNRKKILTDYFQSIGITAAAMPAWEALQAKVQPISNFKCRGEVLK